MIIKKGDIFLANLNPAVGQEMQKTRPVIIVSNNMNNTHAGTVTVVPVTSQKLSKIYPFEVLLPESTDGLMKNSKAKVDQIRTIDKSRLTKKLASIDSKTISELNHAIAVHLDL